MGKVYGLIDLFRKYLIRDISTASFSRIIHLLKSYYNHKTRKRPFTMMLETGNLCNFQCETCPTPRDRIKRPRKNMDFNTFKKIIDNSAEVIHNLNLYWTNEPLLNPELPKMIAYAKSKNLYTDISTNASMLTKKKSKQLIKSGLNKITLCLDGVTKKSYESFREGSNFEVVKNNIINFCKIKREIKSLVPFVELQFIINKFNQDEIEDIKRFAKKNYINKLHLKTFGLVGFLYSNKKRLQLLEKFAPSKEIYSRFEKLPKGEYKIKKQSAYCSSPTMAISVTINGDIAVCCDDFQARYTYGNLIKNRLTDILKAKKAKSILNAGIRRKLPICKNCSYIKR